MKICVPRLSSNYYHSKSDPKEAVVANPISPQRGEARTDVAHCLMCSDLQTRVIYQVQFLRLTAPQWDKLEVTNRSAIRAITVLLRLMPGPMLQEHAQLNTISQLAER